MSKGTIIENILRNGLEKNVGISKERANNYVLFLKKHIENNLGMDIANKQAVTIGKLIAKSIFLGELYIYGLIENNQQIIDACEALKLNSFYDACLFNYIYSVNRQTLEGDLKEILNTVKNKHNSRIVPIPFDKYTSENIVLPNKKDILLYNNTFEKEALWLVKKLDIVRFIKSQQNFSLEHYEYPLTGFGKIKFFSIMRQKQNTDEIFLIAKKTEFNKGLKEIKRMNKINTILKRSKNNNQTIDINIVPLFALLNEKHDCYLITKYIPGETFDDILRVGINKRNNIEQLKKIKNLLFNIGIGWKDLAPRNIIRYFLDNNMPTYYLCDFERNSIIKEGGITEEDKANIEEHAFEEFVDLLSQKELNYLFPSLNKNILNAEKNINLAEIESNRIKTLLKRRDLLFSIGNQVYTKKKHIDTIRHELWLCAKPLHNDKKIISTLYIFDLLTDKISINYRIRLTELLLRNMNTKNYRPLIILLDNFAKAYLTLLLQDEYNSRVISKSMDINAEISSNFAKKVSDLIYEITEGNQLNKFLQKKHFLFKHLDKKSYHQNDKIAKLLEFFGFYNINYILSYMKNNSNKMRRGKTDKK